MENKTVYDVAILGAGPAGSTAALRLQQLGYQVILIEKVAFPRFNIGESLSPGVSDILKYIGAHDLVEKLATHQRIGSSIFWETADQPTEIAAHDNQHLIVERALFDDELLQCCLQKGVEVLQPFSARKISTNKSYCEIQCSSPTGEQRLVQANFIFDATGKQGVLHDEKFYIGPATFAKSITVQAGNFPKQSFLEAHPNFWLWGTYLPQDEVRFIFFQDPIKSSLQPSNAALLAQSRFGQAVAQKANLSEHAFLSYPYWNTQAIGEHCFRLGEAAFALDPLSSSGVEKAMRYSLQAVIAFNTLYQQPEKTSLARAYLQEKLLETAANHVVFNQAFYNTSFTSNQHSFWAKRRRLFVDDRWTGSQEAALYQHYLAEAQKKERLSKAPNHLYANKRALLHQTFTLDKALQYVKKSCVIADCVEERVAVCTPSLGREIAFVNGIELAPLLQMLPASFLLSDLKSYWSNTIDLNQTFGVLTVLLERNILVPSGV